MRKGGTTGLGVPEDTIGRLGMLLGMARNAMILVVGQRMATDVTNIVVGQGMARD